MKRILSALFGCLLVSTASAQNLATTTTAPPNPCSTLGSPPTVGSCWDCFQSLLANCDKENNEAARRQACYTGANNFFTWCLGRVGGANPVTPKPHSNSMNRGEGVIYQLSFEAPVDPRNIEVYIRDVQDGQVRSRLVTSFAAQNDDGSISIFFDNNNLGLENDKTVGVLTVVRDPATLAVTAAFGEVYDLVKATDLTPAGLIEAWESYANGQMSFEEFIVYMNKYLSR